MSVKPYFWPENIYDVKLDKLKATNELDEPKAPIELDDLKVFLFTLKIPKEPTEAIKLVIKCGRGRP
jgi:hypothetical protein